MDAEKYLIVYVFLYTQGASMKKWRFWTRPSGVIYVMFRGKAQWVSTGSKDPEEAERFAVRNCLDNDDPTLTFSEFAADFYLPGVCKWLKRQEQKGRTFRAPYLQKMRGFVDNYLLPRFGDSPIRSIKRREIDDWLMNIKRHRDRQKLKADAKNKIIGCMRSIMEEAVDLGIVERNPCDGIQLFRDVNTERREVFTAEELQKLFPADLEALQDIWVTLPWAAYYFLQASAGLRPGEVSAITWKDWHRSVHGLIVSHSIENATGERKGTKTGTVKPIPLVRRAEEMLLLIESSRKETGPDTLVFQGDGGPILLETSLKHFRASCKRAGITVGKRTQYCLRHSFDTLAMQVLDISAVRDLMGHKTIKHTIETYYHPEDEARIRALPESTWASLEKIWQK